MMFTKEQQGVESNRAKMPSTEQPTLEVTRQALPRWVTEKDKQRLTKAAAMDKLIKNIRPVRPSDSFRPSIIASVRFIEFNLSAKQIRLLPVNRGQGKYSTLAEVIPKTNLIGTVAIGGGNSMLAHVPIRVSDPGSLDANIRVKEKREKKESC
ncbi:hypothetical protein BDV33DRAFT_85332 [Aspergillus novoparasiticus]|uniref:Uncharacterized protein n=1 Tax=Aspergillus novoparasiticus TaxID=986946 RepID=A0A5N6EW83_9EURO|nr:hypothetical protein BDV33DRAFT_85332 [Aspergillus novoparasiticus]